MMRFTERKRGRKEREMMEDEWSLQSCVNCTICACVHDVDSSSFRDLFSITRAHNQHAAISVYLLNA